MKPDDVLEFWFGPPGGEAGAAKRWWEKNADFDAEIRAKFGGLHAAIVRGEHEDWKREAKSCLAYIIVIDQWSRNMFRGAKESFSYDGLAQAATLGGMRDGLDRGLDARQRGFFYMPLVHAEDRSLQDQGVIAFATAAEEVPEAQRAGLLHQLIFAVKHRNIVLRFGRFPHRNEILGRISSIAEIEFLKQPGSSF